MRLFVRRRDASPRDPDLPLTVNQAQRLRETVRWVFAEFGRQVSVHPGHVEDATGEKFGLWNLAAVCAAEPVNQWSALTRIHVRSILSPCPEVTLLSDEELSRMVRLRLAARDELTNPGWHPLSPGPAPDLVELITLDLPDRVVTPPESEFMLREGGLARWRGLARQRLAEHLAEERLDHQQVGLDEADAFHVVTSESVYTASFALLLPELMERIDVRAADAGVLLAVPFRGQVALRVVDGPDAAVVLHHLFRFAMAGYDQAAGGISPHVFWVHDGQWTQVTSIEGKRVRVSVDEDLAEALGLGRE
jgi:hypothetical protein